MPHDEIADDYHATAGAMAAFVDWLTVTYPEAIDAMTSQPPEYLEAPRRGDARASSTTSTTGTAPSRASAGDLGVTAATVDRLRVALLD